MKSSNITLAIDETIAARAREVARQQGTSLNALIREYIEQLAGHLRGEQIYQQLENLWRQGAGRSGGRRFRREDAYEGRVG